MAAVSTGTTCLYGISSNVTNTAGVLSTLFLQSYSVNTTFNLSSTVSDETGLTKTARYDDRKTELTIEGICKTAVMPVIGDSITFTINAETAYPSGVKSVTYVGTITAISQNGSNKDFTSVTITAVDYEGITP
jgi:hypothetical protein